jgi:hypothetical protein
MKEKRDFLPLFSPFFYPFSFATACGMDSPGSMSLDAIHDMLI